MYTRYKTKGAQHPSASVLSHSTIVQDCYGLSSLIRIIFIFRVEGILKQLVYKKWLICDVTYAQYSKSLSSHSPSPSSSYFLLLEEAELNNHICNVINYQLGNRGIFFNLCTSCVQPMIPSLSNVYRDCYGLSPLKPYISEFFIFTSI